MRRRLSAPVLALAVPLLLSSCFRGPLPPSAAVIPLEPMAGESAEAFEARVRQAFSLAQPGTAFEFGAGTFQFTRGLLVSASHVTIAGQGPNATTLDFSNASAAEAILATGDEFVIRNLGIFDPPGDAVKALGIDGFTAQGVSVVWPSEADPTNGPYGLYPVLTNNILIENCYVRGAEDAGIYVGQSSNVVVRYNWAEGNVAGIEIENTINAEVYRNVATKNTGGILVFDLPGLSQPGESVMVHGNWVYDNNGPNFGSGVVGLVPPGTGVLVLSTDDVEVFDNEIYDHKTGGIAVLSYKITLLPFDETVFNPYPEKIHVHDNVLRNNGQDPQGQIGQVIALQFGFGAPVPDIIWDRIIDPDLVQADGHLPPDLQLCVQNNGSATFGTLGIPPSGDRFDLTPYDCAHPAVPEVFLAGRTDLPPAQQPLPPEVRDALCGAAPAGVNWPAFEADCPRLADYNLFAGNDPRGPVTERGLEYDLTTPLHSDYALKYRFAFVPPGEMAQYDPDGSMDFPVGTIIAKTFTFDTPLGERLVETRLLVRRDFGWKALVYLWNDAMTEAVLTPEGAVVEVTFEHPDGSTPTIDYQVPDVNQCAGCHAGVDEPMDLIGPKARYLNRPVPGDGAGPNQLTAWTDAGILAGAPDPALAPRLPDASDPTDGSVAERARTYLEINCAHCHRDGGRAGFTGLWLDVDQPEGPATGICKTPIAAGVGGLTYDVVPGDADQSILVVRMESVQPSIQMPELSKAIAHDMGVALVRQYVEGLPGPVCP